MGIWFKHPHLSGAEQATWKSAANRAQRGRSVGGRLYLTNERLIFEPNRLDAATKGRPWSTLLDAIQCVATESPDGNVVSGGLRTRLRLDLVDGTTELFVVNDLESVVQTIDDGVSKSR